MKRIVKKASSSVTNQVRRLWHQRSREVVAALAGSALLCLLGGYIFLAGRVSAGHTLAWDEQILRSLRRPDNPAVPIGPDWLRSATLDITALGSPVLLSFFILASIGFLYFERQRRLALATFVTAGGGALLSLGLKYAIARPRPSVVPHLQDVMNTSFPSGHTMGAAVVYLTLGVMFMKSFRSRRAKAFCLFWACFFTLIVGLSRIYLGVHYPSDVLGGWIAGAAWALTGWAVSVLVPNRPLPDVDDAPLLVKAKAHGSG